MKTSLPCLEGSATLFPGSVGQYERPYILTGARKRPDSLHWALIGKPAPGDFDRFPGSEYPVAVMGLARGRYADAICEARDLHKALLGLGMVKSAGELARACAANGLTL